VSMAPLLLALMLSVVSSHPEQNALRINIARVEAAETNLTNPEFAITLENRGAKELVIAVGWKIGTRMYPHGLTLLLTDANGHTDTLRYRLPLRIGGRIDPYLLPTLPMGARHTLRVFLSQYTSPYTGEGRTRPPAEGELNPNLPRGTYTIQARLEEAPLKIGKPDVQWPPANLWTGVVLSNVVTFTIP